MEELKLSARKKIKVWIGDVAYEINKPNNKELYDLHQKQKSVGEEGSVELMVELLETLGLPRDVFWQLDPGSSEQIVQALIPQKKTS
jgi:hypothetical protein